MQEKVRRCPGKARSRLTLGESSLDLTDINQGIDASANVHVDIGSYDRPVSGQSVDLYLADGGALGDDVYSQHVVQGVWLQTHLCKVEEGLALLGDPVEADVWSLVVSDSGQVYPIKVGGVCELLECRVRHLFSIRRQSCIQLVTGVLDRHAVEITGSTGSGGRGVDCRHGVGFHDVDLFQRCAELIGTDLRHLAMQSLTL